MIEWASYFGYRLAISDNGILVVAPDGYERSFMSMSRARLWIRRRRKA